MGKYPGAVLTYRHGNIEDFGKYYIGSKKADRAHLKRKRMMKQNRKR